MSEQIKSDGRIRGRGIGTTRRFLAIAAAAATLAAALAACSSNTSGESPKGKASGIVGDTLTVAYASVPQTLDPAKTVQNNSLIRPWPTSP